MLSILIPTYNYNALPLAEILEQQTLKLGIVFELICIDDGSFSEHNKQNQKINTLTNSTSYPDAISLSETVFSSMNLVVFGLLLVAIPLMLYRKAKNSRSEVPELAIQDIKQLIAYE